MYIDTHCITEKSDGLRFLLFLAFRSVQAKKKRGHTYAHIRTYSYIFVHMPAQDGEQNALVRHDISKFDSNFVTEGPGTKKKKEISKACEGIFDTGR